MLDRILSRLGYVKMNPRVAQQVHTLALAAWEDDQTALERSERPLVYRPYSVYNDWVEDAIDALGQYARELY